MNETFGPDISPAYGSIEISCFSPKAAAAYHSREKDTGEGHQIMTDRQGCRLAEGAVAPRVGRGAQNLPGAVDLPQEALAATIARFNGFAEIGKDTDFGRGDSLYDRANGDASHGPNPCLGPIDTRALYAVKLEATPLGTSRGIATDTEARAVGETGEIVPGLYVCGNDMQSAFGGEYPGAGAQLGQAMCFAWIAARNAAGLN